jgi:tetratricopeptide (TPR) repeat protein
MTAAEMNATGIRHRIKGELDLAIAAYQEALRLDSNFVEAHSNLGEALYQKGNLDQAILSFREALQLRPGHFQALANMGNVLRKLGRLEQAVGAYEAALGQQPDCFEVMAILGDTHLSIGNLDAAFEFYQRAAALRPGDAGMLWNIGLIHLRRGEFEKGWPLIEWRKKIPGTPMNRGFAQPEWDGWNAVGKTLLVYGEGGYGDSIQFIRYVPLLRERAAQVVLECPPALVALFRSFPGMDELITQGDAPPSFDVQISLPSLPGVFKTKLDNVPNRVPYLAAPDDRLAIWRDRVPSDGLLNLGICWAGNRQRSDDDARSCPPDLFGPLLRVPGARFFNLQLGTSAESLSGRLVDYTSKLRDFADTAAMVHYMDLVISVDTSVAHLAGALARPVWLLTSFVPAYQWLMERSDSPWYPTMRLFRQRKRGDWSGPLAEVEAALRGLARTIERE